MPCPIRELSDGESLPSVLASMSERQALRDVGVRHHPFRLITCTRERVHVFHFTDGTRNYFVGAATQDEAHALAEFGHDRVCKLRDGSIVPFPKSCGICESFEFANFGRGLADELEEDRREHADRLHEIGRKRWEMMQAMRDRDDPRCGSREFSESWPTGELGWIDLGDLIREDPWLPPRYREMVSA